MRLRIESLLKMARITTDVDMRERYIAEAYGLVTELGNRRNLNSVGDESSAFSSFESFVDTHLVKNNKVRTDRRVLYEKYLNFCEETKSDFFARNTFYKLLVSEGFHQQKSYGLKCFFVDYCEEKNMYE